MRGVGLAGCILQQHSIVAKQNYFETLLHFRDLSPIVRIAAEPAAAASARTSNVDGNRSGLR